MEPTSKKFPGFPPKRVAGNFWCYPNVLCLHWHELTGAQQKLIDVILRHTWGFNRSTDRISLSQMERGVGTIHHGAGISRRHIIRTLRSLEAKGYITAVRSSRTNEYSLVTSVHQEQGTRVNQNSVTTSSATGDNGKHNTGVERLHTIKGLDIEETIKKIHDVYSHLIFPGTRENEPVPRLTKSAHQKIMQRLTEFEPEKLRDAIKNFSHDEWMMRNNGTRGIAWFFASEDRIEQFLNLGKLDDFSNRNY